MNIQMDHTSPYADQVRKSMNTELPDPSLSNADTLDYITDLLVGTKNTRYGPRPSIEGLAKIRATIRTAIRDEKPVPILMPWGSRKPPLDASIDSAEFIGVVGLVRTMRCLKTAYSPGVDFVLRVEDESGLYLFESEGPKLVDASKKYVNDFVSLVRVLDPAGTINLTLESDLFDISRFTVEANRVFPIMHQYILASENLSPSLHDDLPTFKDLVLFGWRGPISQPMREYYRNVYLKYHPGDDPNIQLARYFSSALARRIVHGTGVRDEWKNGFVKLYFSHPVPDSPMDDSTIYLRTMPEKYTRTHIAPWRARGIFQLDDNEEITPKIVSWRDSVEVDSGFATVMGNGGSAVVRVDIVSNTDR